MKSERTWFSRSLRPRPKLDGRLAGLTLEDPATGLFGVESASIPDLHDPQLLRRNSSHAPLIFSAGDIGANIKVLV
jgi:hypothetical protein